MRQVKIKLYSLYLLNIYIPRSLRVRNLRDHIVHLTHSMQNNQIRTYLRNTFTLLMYDHFCLSTSPTAKQMFIIWRILFVLVYSLIGHYIIFLNYQVIKPAVNMLFEKVYDVPIGMRLLHKIPILRNLSCVWKNRW